MIRWKLTCQRLYLSNTFLDKHYSLLWPEGGVVTFNTFSITKYEAKAIPVKARTSPEVSRSLRLSDFKTIST